jgi:hypothetical protein
MPTSTKEEFLQELERFRPMFAGYHDQALLRATEAKEPNETYVVMVKLYQGLGTNGRRLANVVLSEWLDSEDAGRQFTAFGLIRKFRITDAIPSLEKFIQVHQSPMNAEGRADLAKATQVLALCQAALSESVGTQQ